LGGAGGEYKYFFLMSLERSRRATFCITVTLLCMATNIIFIVDFIQY
jgi:hypothetical protein